MPGNKKKRAAAGRKSQSSSHTEDGIDIAHCEAAYKEFEEAGGTFKNPASKKKAAKKSASRRRLALGLIQWMCALMFLAVVASRWDFFTAFGAGSGISKAHVSPLSVAARAAKQSKFIQKNYKLRQSSQRALHAIASVGELVADIHTQYVAKESVLKSRKKKKKKNKTKSDKKEPSRWKRGEKWLKRTQQDSSLKQVVDDNYFLGIGSAVCLVGAVLSVLVPDAIVVSLFGLGGMFVGANGNTTRPEPLVYIAMGILLVGYVAGQYKDPDAKKRKKKSRRHKKQKKDKKERNLEKED